MKNNSIKNVVAIGIGAALFFVLGRYVQIPSPVPNTSINLQYGVLAVFAMMFGPLAGALIGLIGHTLIDMNLYGPWWSWIIASAIFGLICGLVGKKINLSKGEMEKKDCVIMAVTIVISNLIAWLVVAPVLDIIIYAEPADKVFVQGLTAAIANSVTAIIVGVLLAVSYTKTIAKKGSLDKE